MSIVDKVLGRLEKKKERQGKPRKREAEIWEMEKWLIGTGNVRKRRKAKSNAYMITNP